jgi:hypothetical protein
MDPYNNDPSIFTGSNKINDNPNQILDAGGRIINKGFTWGPGSSPNKNEIQNAGLHFTHGDGIGSPASHLWALFAGDRQVTNGSSYIDFEFLHQPLLMTSNPNDPIVYDGNGYVIGGSGGFANGLGSSTGGRSPDDLLVTIEFVQGGGDANVVIRKWENLGGTWQYVVKPNIDYVGKIFITNNTVNTSVPFDVYGSGAGSGAYVPNQWAEGAVDLTAILGIIGLDPCLPISTVFVRTRSSGSSAQSELKDFIGSLIQLAPTATASNSGPVCSNVTSISLNETGGDAVSWSWTTDGSAVFSSATAQNPTVTGFVDGEKFTVNILDAVGCPASANTTIKVYPNPTVTVNSPTICASDNTAQITATPSPAGTYTYKWTVPATASDPGNVASFSASVAGDYSVLITDGTSSKCTGTGEGTLTINANPVVKDATAIFCDEDQTNTTLSAYDANVGPGSGYTVAWFSDAARSIPATTTGNLAVGDHIYYATVTNSTTTCNANAQLTITINATPVVEDATDTFCDEDQTNTSLSAYDANVGPGSGYTVAWFSDAARSIPATTIGNLAVGDHIYYATVTNDLTKCKANAQLTITINATPIVKNATDKFCVDKQSNTILSGYDSNVGPGTGYSVAWFSDAARTISITETGDLAEGDHTYYATVTNDLTKCKANAQLVLTINPLPAIVCPKDALSDVDCGVSAVEAQASSDTRFATWFAQFKTSNPVFEPVVDYVYTPASAQPASGTAPLIPKLGVPDVIQTSVTVTWTITDDNGCINSCSSKFDLSYACAISCNTVATNLNCNGDKSGTITVTPTGGILPYNLYLFKKPDLVTILDKYEGIPVDGAQVTFTGLAAGDYLVISTDAATTIENGSPCTATITEPKAVALEILNTNVSCNGLKDGTLSIDNFDGTGTPTFSLSTDGTNFDVTTETDIESAIYGPGTYYIKVSYPDGNTGTGTCDLTKSTTINEPALVSIKISGTNVTCNGNGDGTLSIDNYSGGDSPKFFLKKDAGEFVESTKEAIEAGSYGPGTYTIRIEYPDGNNPPGFGICSSAEDKVIIEPSQVVLTISSTNVTCNEKADGKLVIETYSGDGTPTFYLKTGAGEFVETTEEAIEAGSYGPNDYIIKVSYPDGNSPPGEKTCFETKPATITQPDVVIAKDESTKANCIDGKDGSVTLTFSGGTSPYMVDFNGGGFESQTSPITYSGLATGTYNWIVKDANECSVPGSEDVGFIPCEKALCTYTQGAYGNSGGKYCDGTNGKLSTSELISQAIAHAGGKITVGVLGTIMSPNYSVSISSTDVDCVISRLPGGGPAKELSAGDVSICSETIPLKNGRITNGLLSQTITLALNVNIKETSDLASFELQAGTLATAAIDGGCGADVAKTRVCGYCDGEVWIKTVNEYTYRTFSAGIIKALGDDTTVAGLLDLANRALANSDGIKGKEEGVSLSDISSAVASVNEVFDGCRISMGWDQEKCPSEIVCLEESSSLSTSHTSDSHDDSTNGRVKVYPNPFRDHLTFEITADVSANASLQIFNLLGQKIAELFSGYLEVGTMKVVEYNSYTSLSQTDLIFVYKLGKKTYTGKLKMNK